MQVNIFDKNGECILMGQTKSILTDAGSIDIYLSEVYREVKPPG